MSIFKTILSVISIIISIFCLIVLIRFCFDTTFRHWFIENDYLEMLKVLTPILVAIFVYKYTTDNHKRTLLNELDSKSEWRKTLFEIAGSSENKMKNLYQFRAALRFTYKNEDKYFKHKYFDCMNIIIIKYCENLISQKRTEDNEKNENKQSNLENYEMDSIRLFCIYMLADHWEKNQNKNFKFADPEKEIELCIDTLQKFLTINDKNYCYKSHKNNLDRDNLAL
ncbi:hypothetical protein [Staphylococcus haemolyticus]|uniref:hypothetical protein n=1 Tax=Staphylococcus haemolyticus TaxID=1283 RepID=UPI00069E7CF2|nr:hypothetical protein [Staphylococcus haemolyticus]